VWYSWEAYKVLIVNTLIGREGNTPELFYSDISEINVNFATDKGD